MLGLEYLHGNSIIYRDVKPDNTLVYQDGHIMLSDFGVSKIALSTVNRHTQVGTPMYMPPEQLRGESYSFHVDFWATAVMLHEILTLETVGSCDAPELRTDSLTLCEADLLTKMLVSECTERLGYGERGVLQIKAHQYFADVDWDKVSRKAVRGPVPITQAIKADSSYGSGALKFD